MALPATDSFTTGSNQALTTYSSNWTYQGTGAAFQVFAATDDCGPNGANGDYDYYAYWNVDTFNDDQYAEVTINSLYDYNYLGPAVRVATGSWSGYHYVGESADGSYVVKVVSGSFTQLGSSGNTFSATDVIRIEAEGTTITPYINGSTTGTPGAQTDSSIASGYAGINGGRGDTGGYSLLDDWEGGNLAGGITVSVNVQTITFSQPTPAITGAVAVTAGPQTLTFSQPASSIIGNAVTTINTLTATFSSIAATILGRAFVDANSLTATFSTIVPTILMGLDVIYNSFKKDIMDGTIDLDTDSIKLMLVTDVYVPNQDNHTRKSDITNEIVGSGYTAGGEIVTIISITQDNTDNLGLVTANNVMWSVASFSAKAAVLYKDTGVASTSPLIAYFDFGSTQSPTNEAFEVEWFSSEVLALL